MVDHIGQQLGNYRLVKMLGQGGYAEVYLGQHVRFKQQAALKVLHAHLSDQEAKHFQQEAETIATLAHPSIIRVLDFDVQDGVPFLVIDYAPGGTLRRRYPKGNLVPLPVIVSTVKQVADALHYAHEQKFIHRDVKPENILVGRHQEVLLSDFGIATIAHSTSSLGVGSEGASGTLAYMAPEQIEGHPRAASDQYALAVVVYEWLCGERPFEGSVSELIAQQLSMPPPLLRERAAAIPAEVEQVVLRALAKDPKARFASVADFARALKHASQRALIPTAQLTSAQAALGSIAVTGDDSVAVAPSQAMLPTGSTPSADLPVGDLEPTVYPGSAEPKGHDTPQSGATSETPQRGQLVLPTAAVVPSPLEPPMPVQRKARRIPRSSAVLLIGLVVVIIAGGVLGSVSLLAHFGVIGTHSGSPALRPVRGGSWTDMIGNADSFIPNASLVPASAIVDQALYLPLFYGDAHGVVHPGAATRVPSVQNGDVSPDARTWTFHLKPHLVWSDGQPYDARDVDFTWRLWANPKFAAGLLVPNLITSADISADHLTITFHLTRAYASFVSLWVDGIQAPLPAHHFSRVAPEAISKSPDNRNPKVTSGPFMMAESIPGEHYTLVRNPRYYRASEGLPYLDKVIFRNINKDTILKELQAGTIDSTAFLDVSQVQEARRLTHYTLVTSPTSGSFEALYFNFHNQVLATHLEVRQAMAFAIDHQVLLNEAALGFASLLCTDHPSAYHPGYEVQPPCPEFNPAAANKLLDDNGWAKGTDGVRTRGGERLEFEYSTNAKYNPWRLATEAVVQRNFSAIGIKLDIQNYPGPMFFGSFLPGGKASPPTGAISDRYDIAEFNVGYGYDPDDASLLACDQFPPQGSNFDFYCNQTLDALYHQEQATADQGARQQIFTQIHQIYLTEFPFIVLYSLNDFSIVRKGTHNYQPNPFEGEAMNVWEWWCDGGKC
jgi:ABC-type transport system substrate-binding protein/serine/threonine protein kinase